MFGFGPDIYHGNFSSKYKVLPVSMMQGNIRTDVEKGGKIIMPPSALDQLTKRNISYPMLFKLTNNEAKRVTHCGVLEFVANEGYIYIPMWMMRNLCLNIQDVILLESISLKVASYGKFQPQTVDFLDISNPKAVLENALRSYACLTQGDIISIPYMDREYEIFVVETKPDSAVSIIECDMNLDFAAPVGYKEPVHEKNGRDLDDSSHQRGINEIIKEEQMKIFLPFKGQGNRLDGRKKKTEYVHQDLPDIKRGIPNYDYVPGNITFLRNIKTSGQVAAKVNDDPIVDFEPFSGAGKSLKQPKTRTKRR